MRKPTTDDFRMSKRDYRVTQAERLIEVVKEAGHYERHIHTLKCQKIDIEEAIESAAVELAALGSEYRDITGLTCNCEFMNVNCDCEVNDEGCPDEPFHMGTGGDK